MLTRRRLEVLEPAPEALDEDRAVAQAGQRIEEADAAQPLLGDRLFGRVGQRAGDAVAPVPAVGHGETAAEKPSVGAVFAADAVLVLEHRRLPRKVRLERLVHRRHVVWMHAVEPFFWPNDLRVRRQSDHRAPAARDVELVGLQVPLPQPVVGAFGRQREPLAGALQLVLGVGPLGDVVPQERDAAGDRQDLDLENAHAGPRRQPELRQHSRLVVRHRGLDRARQFGLRERRHGGVERQAQGAFARAAEHPLERVVPHRDPARAIDHRHALVEEVDDLTAAALFFQLLHVVGVRPVGEAASIRQPPAALPTCGDR